MKKNRIKIIPFIVLIASLALLIINLLNLLNSENLTEKQVLSYKLGIISNLLLAISMLIIILFYKDNNNKVTQKKTKLYFIAFGVAFVSSTLLVLNLVEYLNFDNLTEKQLFLVKIRILINFLLTVGMFYIMYKERKKAIEKSDL